MGAFLSALSTIGGVILRFGRFLLPVMGSIWPQVLRLLSYLTGSWSRIISWIVIPLSMGACEAGLYESAFEGFSAQVLETRSFLFAKITEPFPPFVQGLGAFVNSVFPLDTLFTAFGLVIAAEVSFISLALAGKIVRKLLNLTHPT